jgi:hypothetical protein
VRPSVDIEHRTNQWRYGGRCSSCFELGSSQMLYSVVVPHVLATVAQMLSWDMTDPPTKPSSS